MIIQDRPKKQGQGRTVVKTAKRLPINLDLSALDLMCNYVLTENRNIRRGQYIALRNLMGLLDMSKYTNDPERYKRVIDILKKEFNL